MKHITMEDWKKAAAKVGDSVDDNIIDELFHVAPPTFLNSRCLQIGHPQREIYDAEADQMRSTYLTFSKEGNQWIYCGCCFQGKNTEPTLTL